MGTASKRSWTSVVALRTPGSYRALRVRDGKELTQCAASRNSTNSIALLESIEADNPSGDIFIIADHLSSHNSAQTCTWLAEHPRLHQIFIPKGARLCSVGPGELVGSCGRLLRRDALAGQSFANAHEIEQATRVTTVQLNHRAKSWVWGCPPKPRQHLHRLFSYRLSGIEH